MCIVGTSVGEVVFFMLFLLMYLVFRSVLSQPPLFNTLTSIIWVNLLIVGDHQYLQTVV